MSLNLSSATISIVIALLAIPIVITHGELVWIGIDAAIAGGVTEGAPCWSAAFAGGGIALMV